MSQAEIIVIMIMIHSPIHKCLKHFYLNKICDRYMHLFSQTVSYNWFTELEKSVVVQFVIIAKMPVMSGKKRLAPGVRPALYKG